MSFFELETKPEEQQAIADIGRENLGISVKTEEGTLAMYHATQKNAPNLNVIVEIYQDEAAYHNHTAATHFKKFVEIAKTAVTERKVLAVEPQFLAEKQALTELNGNRYSVKLAEVKVKPEHTDAFKNIVLGEMYQSMQKETGVLVMYAVTLQDRPDEWRFFEIYADEGAYQRHRETAHFKAYIEQTKDMLLDKKLRELTGMTLMSKGRFQLK